MTTTVKYLCTESQAAAARKAFRETGVRHDVIDVSFGGTRRGGYQAVVPHGPDGIPPQHRAAGSVTLLYTADGGPRWAAADGVVHEN